MYKSIVYSISILLLSCYFTTEKKVKQEPVSTISNQGIIDKVDTIVIPSELPIYTWINDYKPQNGLINQISVPSGYKRLQPTHQSFGYWLQFLPLKPEASSVFYHSGVEKPNKVHFRVIDLDTGKRDLQQCADAVMRLKAEYHYARGEYANIHFNYTSGHRVSFDDWRKGKKPIIKGNKVLFSSPTGNTNNTYKNFKRYMMQIFSYAGTASLSKELVSVPIAQMEIGDVFIQGGFPGHAVIVIDMAENAEGEKIFMLAQSYMPAQDMHILKNDYSKAFSPWYRLDFGEILSTPEWSFHKTDLKRFK